LDNGLLVVTIIKKKKLMIQLIRPQFLKM